jgi:predicted small lipoprotein YifL
MLKITNCRLVTTLAMAGLLNLAGCGQTGPLYLPQKLTQAPDVQLPLAPKPIIARLRAS